MTVLLDYIELENFLDTVVQMMETLLYDVHVCAGAWLGEPPRQVRPWPDQYFDFT